MARRSHGRPPRLAGTPPGVAAPPARQTQQAATAAARGRAAERAGHLQTAYNWYHAAVTADPTHAEAHRRLAGLLLRTGQPEQATGIGLKAMALDPKDAATAASLAGLLRAREITLARSDPSLNAGIVACLTQTAVNPDDFHLIAEAALKAWPPVAALVTAARGGRPPEPAWYLSDTGRQVLTAPLMLAFLSRTLSTDPDIEALLTVLRHGLTMAPEQFWQAPHILTFATALARQLRISEHVPESSAEERTAEAEAATDLDRCGDLAPAHARALLILALHDRLSDHPNADLWRDQADRLPKPVGDFVRETVTEDLELRTIAASIPCLTSPAEEVSAKVQAQYEENPYPRWLQLQRPKPGGWREELQALAGAPVTDLRARHPRVLIAGCGTGRQPLARAIGYGERSDILAIDLSRQSLAYAIHRARSLGVRNVRFAQADLLALTRDEIGDFDIIEAVGVLHHLADPMAGWRALGRLLRPGGLMRVGLYSRRGRADINRLRAEIRRLGIPATPAGIRTYRQDLLRSGEPHARRVVAGLRDVHTLSGCRDLLFHVQEHQFTLPEIADALKALDLRLIAFERHANMAGRLPGPADLDGWIAAESANPDLFRAMYLFWCRKG